MLRLTPCSGDCLTDTPTALVSCYGLLLSCGQCYDKCYYNCKKYSCQKEHEKCSDKYPCCKVRTLDAKSAVIFGSC